MSIEIIHFRKLLKILYSEPNQRISMLRADIRDEIARETGESSSGGGDFHVPFWSDAKRHVFNTIDLYAATEGRIESNPRRARLYPVLRDGFLQWWNNRRRLTNEPFHEVDAPHARYVLNGLGTIKVENMLAVLDAGGEIHFIYPYFSEFPTLNQESSRVALWLIGQAFPHQRLADIRILDVIRGQIYSIVQSPLQGDEQDILSRRYRAAINDWRRLRVEYQ